MLNQQTVQVESDPLLQMKFFALISSRCHQAMVLLLIVLTVIIISPSNAAPKLISKKISKATKKPLIKSSALKKPNTNDHNAKNKIKDKKLIIKNTSNKHNTVKKTKSKNIPKGGKPKAAVIQKFPKLSEFFSKKTFEFKGRTRLTQCEVTTKREPCLYLTTPKKGHCLRFQNIINEMTPYYRPFISRSKLNGFSSHEVKDVKINTCSRRVTLITKPQGNFTIYPKSKYMFFCVRTVHSMAENILNSMFKF